MRKLIFGLLLTFCMSAFAACQSKTSDMDDTTTGHSNTDAAEGNPEAGVGATGTDNTTGETGTAADTNAHHGHDHSDPNHTH